MQIHVLYDLKGKVHALLQPSTEADAPRLEFRPARGQRTALLEVPAALAQLEVRAMHAVVAVENPGKQPRLVQRKR